MKKDDKNHYNKVKKNQMVNEDGLDFADQSFIGPSLMKKIVQPEIRLKIFLALYLYPELYVSQLSRLLNLNKNTASRHLRKMKKDGILVTREQPVEGRINKIFYSLNDQYTFDIDEYRKLLDFDTWIYRLFDDQEESENKSTKNPFREQLRSETIDKFFGLTKSLVMLMNSEFKFFKKVLDNAEKKIHEPGNFEDLFKQYFQPPRKIDFYPIFISENKLAKANELYKEYTEKLLELRNEGDEQGEQRSLLFLHSVIPIKDMLEKFTS